MRVCAELGCPEVIPTGTRDGRCDNHRRAKDRARGTRQERGYDAEHDRLRASYQRRMDEGEQFACWRGGESIDPTDWTLGHCDEDRTKHHGPECPPCDYATTGRTYCPHPSHRGISPCA